jgi:TetR/AcrR family transcriptional repressor of lmrAB and yxaGH operons
MSRTKSIAQREMLLRMRSAFRRHGYVGASMSTLAAETGIVKAALYHHFPAGKTGMAEAVLDDIKEWVGNHVLEPLANAGTPRLRINAMVAGLRELYAGGTEACLLGLFANGEALDNFQTRLASSLDKLISGIATALVAAGLDEPTARSRGERAVIVVQGALVVVRAMGDTKFFTQTMDTLADELLQGTGW